MQYTQAQIDRANAVSLEDFLRTQGETLIKSGREYRWKEHDSLTVRGSKWFRHSQSEGCLLYPSKGKSGKHLTGLVIYGYLWNEARDQWLVDPEAAEVVKRIFAMTIDGYGPYQIASKLKSEKILIPSAYLAQHGEGVNKNKSFKDVYGLSLIHISSKRVQRTIK